MAPYNAQARHDAIVRVAAEEFDEVGYAAASLSRIAARLGRTKGALSYHFASKAQLARTVVEAQYAQWEDFLEKVHQRYRGIDALILVSFVVGARFRDDVLVRAAIQLQSDPGTRGIDLPTPFVAWIGMTTRLLVEATSLGEVDTVLEPETAAEVLVEAFTGAQERARQLNAMQDLERHIRGYWLLCLPGLGILDGTERLRRLAMDAAAY